MILAERTVRTDEWSPRAGQLTRPNPAIILAVTATIVLSRSNLIMRVEAEGPPRYSAQCRTHYCAVHLELGSPRCWVTAKWPPRHSLIPTDTEQATAATSPSISLVE